jgi:tetratricopeptide (TPR) repeat protein
MNISFKNTALTLGLVAVTGIAFGQKKNETSAAVEFKNKYMTSLMTGDVENAKKALLAAKEFVDLAAAHEETKDSQKTLWLKGEIYANFLVLGMQSMDTAFIRKGGDDAIDISIAAFDKAYDAGNKMKSDVEESVYQKIALLNQFAGMTYNAEEYEAAGELYETEAKYSDAIDKLDSAAVFNASLCYEKAEKYEKAAIGYERLAAVNYRGTTSAILASSAHRKAGNLDKAKAIINEARKTNPSDKELLLELVNTNIDAGDAAGAEKALADAIKTDPNNKQLHYTIGTIYIDLKENEKAETALNKALEIDPNYADAQYQLGAHLVTWAGDLKLQADQMPFGDANYNKIKQQSGEVFERALIPLEKYIVNFPEDKDVLTILFQLQRNLGNSEKAIEYKKRADAIK